MTEGKALQPLANGGIVLIVGAKSSNFDDEIRTHPRVTIWDSQNESWTSKEMPSNTRAVFMTRFISHATSTRILSEARAKQVTIFNPDGTGMIAKQVKELLAIGPVQRKPAPVYKEDRGKLKPLIPFIQFSLTNVENARILVAKAKELSINTTEASLAQLVGTERRKHSETGVPRSIRAKVDVSVEILDNMIQELKDMRDFLITTVTENNHLRAKLENFKKVLSD